MNHGKLLSKNTVPHRVGGVLIGAQYMYGLGVCKHIYFTGAMSVEVHVLAVDETHVTIPVKVPLVGVEGII